MLFTTISSNFVQEYVGDVIGPQKRYHGKGQITYKSGNLYEGDFEFGKLEGKGIYRWKDGVLYSGEFKNNKITGTGEYKW
jgi:hypothetical protein